MTNPPAELVQLGADTNWEGGFFNWTDDFSKTPATSMQDAVGAQLWAWRTHLIKWISQVSKDGTCHLPTLELVKRAAKNCLATGASPGRMGDIQNCRS
jgi:hypothetical protein